MSRPISGGSAAWVERRAQRLVADRYGPAVTATDILEDFWVSADDQQNARIDYTLGGGVSPSRSSLGTIAGFSDGNDVGDLGALGAPTAGVAVGYVASSYSWNPSPCGVARMLDVGDWVSVSLADAHDGATTTAAHDHNSGCLGELLFCGTP
jgi:hypothetical protein